MRQNPLEIQDEDLENPLIMEGVDMEN